MNYQKIPKVLRDNSDKLTALAGVEVNEARLINISNVFSEILGATSMLCRGLVYQSCLHLLDTVPDQATIRESLRRVLANEDYIWKGTTIPIWMGEPVTVPIGVARASEVSVKGSMVTHIYFRVLEGIPAGMLMDITAPSWWVIKTLNRKLGLFRSGLTLSPSDIAGTKFYVCIRSVNDKKGLTWEDVHATKSQKDYNKEFNSSL